MCSLRDLFSVNSSEPYCCFSVFTTTRALFVFSCEIFPNFYLLQPADTLSLSGLSEQLRCFIRWRKQPSTQQGWKITSTVLTYTVEVFSFCAAVYFTTFQRRLVFFTSLRLFDSSSYFSNEDSALKTNKSVKGYTSGWSSLAPLSCLRCLCVVALFKKYDTCTLKMIPIPTEYFT